VVELTHKQRRIFTFIDEQLGAGKLCPSREEIRRHFGFRSPRAVADHVAALIRKGYLMREPGKARSLRPVAPLSRFRRRVVAVPILGSIPAGFPENLEPLAEGAIPIDLEALGITWTRRTFALVARGDSMIGKNICDGDWVILEHGPEPRPGQVVAALIDGESTLKTFIRKNGKPYLKAENARYPDLIPSADLTIQGVFRGLIRRAER